MSTEQSPEGADHRIQGTVLEPSVVVHPDRLALHETSRIDSFTMINCSGGVTVDERSVIHAGSHLVGGGGADIGARSVVTYNCVLVTGYPDPSASMSSLVPKAEVRRREARIVLEDETFVGSNAVVMPGVTLEEGAVVAAGSYVDSDVPPWTIQYPNGDRRKRRFDPPSRHEDGH